MQTWRTWIETIGRDVRAALVGALTLTLLGSLLTLCIAVWNSIMKQPFQWTINVGIGFVGVVMSSSALIALVLSGRKRPEHTPLIAKTVHTGGKYRLKLTFKNTVKLIPEQVVIELTLEPAEPVFITIHFLSTPS